MEFIRSFKFSAIVFGVLCACAIAGVAVGWYLHEEPGLMEDAPRWEETPLTVCAHPYVSGDRETAIRCEETVDHVVGLVNDRLDFAMLEHVPFSTTRTCEVDVTCGYPADEANEPGGSALLVPGRCDVRLVNVHGELLTLGAYHEIGHCLGLADENGWNPQSIMRDEQIPTPDLTMPPWISDHDRAILRGLYAPEGD